ncbi:MAG: DUF1800 domain-containing protein [Acetobacteraceae bacterium]|nr:DUF1800 domain-containing protein [Acetobacteraceae bacterium]
MDLAPMQALLRFGLGGTAGSVPPADPKAWLRSQLAQPDPARLDPTPTTAEALEALKYDRENKPLPGQSQTRALYRRDAQAALTAAIATPAPFRERLVWFWTNHFTVSTRRGRVAGLIGPFIQEAIRPHVTGRFSDMLLAVMRHPAMLIYLDNAGSVGPNSRAGLRTHRGLNENLARECLELHTVTPAAGYTQADVTSFARILTGWSIDLKQDPPGFRFRPFAHEPGEQTLMGRRFPPGEQGGIEALRFLGTHPATYHHIATQLVCHFVADNTPPDAVQQIEAVLHDTRGDLGAVSLALINLQGAWQPQTKLRTPADLVLATLRLFSPPEAPPQALGALFLLGQPMWSAPQPNGWPDRAADWTAPEAVMRRIDFAYAAAGRAANRDPGPLAETALGPLIRPATFTAIQRAGSRREAIALLLASPEFQRR